MRGATSSKDLTRLSLGKGVNSPQGGREKEMGETRQPEPGFLKPSTGVIENRQARMIPSAKVGEN